MTEWADLISKDLDVARRTLENTSGYVRANVAHELAPGITRAAEDPYVLIRFGQLWARLHAAQLLLTRARRVVQAAASGDPVANGALLQAQAFSRDVAHEVANQSAVWTGNRGNDPAPRAADFGTPWSYQRVGTRYLNDQVAEPVARWEGTPRIRDSAVLRTPVLAANAWSTIVSLRVFDESRYTRSIQTLSRAHQGLNYLFCILVWLSEVAPEPLSIGVIVRLRSPTKDCACVERDADQIL
jgi:Acyl-CoA dehydrogenase, C-terminal domain